MSEYDVQDQYDALDGYTAPAQCEQVFGHDQQSDFLAAAYASGRMHHAFLFNGAPGIGKASLAFAFAKHIIIHPNFLHAPKSIDGTVPHAIVRQIAIGAHPQVLHLTRPLDPKTGKHKTQLTVEETRKIGHFLSYTVAGNGHRIVIIDPVNDMNANAANALLKNLEEPTPRTVFILIAHSSGSLLPTIKSRCLTLRFQSLDELAMRSALGHLGIATRAGEDEVAELIRRSNGSPRTAAMLLDRGGLEIIRSADTLLSNARFDPRLALKLGEVISSREAEPIFLLLCDYLLQKIVDLSKTSIAKNASQAKKLASMHASYTAKMNTVSEYNLDKRQAVLDLLFQIHSELQTG